MEDYRLDSHKLMYHPTQVSAWSRNEEIFPINVEIGISGACNQRCIFCSMDYCGYKPELLNARLLLPNLKEMQEKGLKSLVLAGNGEPLVNKEAPQIINIAKSYGIDVAISTNGVLFTNDIADECMESLTWMRFSMSAYSNEKYKSIHGAKDGDIDKVFSNIAYASELKRKNHLKSTIGVQLLLIPENVDEAYQLGKKARELGADYFTVKSFAYQPQSNSRLKKEVNWEDFYLQQKELEQKISELSTDAFQALYRRTRIDKMKTERTYQTCHALDFYSFIDSAGNVWPCCTLLGNEGMCFGNIYENKFIDIWQSEQRRNAILTLEKNGLNQCSIDCRLDPMNRYLQEVKYPNNHVNFI